MLCCGLEKNGMVGAWHGHGMASVNQTRPHCVNQMGKTHSKPLAARHGRGTAWTRHAMCESALRCAVASAVNHTVVLWIDSVLFGRWLSMFQKNMRSPLSGQNTDKDSMFSGTLLSKYYTIYHHNRNTELSNNIFHK